jgi:hypothetical protein
MLDQLNQALQQEGGGVKLPLPRKNTNVESGSETPPGSHTLQVNPLTLTVNHDPNDSFSAGIQPSIPPAKLDWTKRKVPKLVRCLTQARHHRLMTVILAI